MTEKKEENERIENYYDLQDWGSSDWAWEFLKRMSIHKERPY